MPSPKSRLMMFLKLLGVAVLYTLLARVALTYLAENGVVSIVWLPSGLALAALLLGGRWYAGSVFLGALLANAMTENVTPVMAVTIATGNTLEALLGAWLLTRSGKFSPDIPTLQDYFRLIFLAGGVGSLIAALSGSTTLLVSGHASANTYVQSLAYWWMGDMLGIILLTPLLLIWQRMPSDWFEEKRLPEAALMLALMLIAGQIVFHGWFGEHAIGLLAKGYWMFMFVVWMAIRLGTHGIVMAVMVTAVQALLGSLRGLGFFADDLAKTHLTNYWSFFVIMSVVGMALAIYLAERKRNVKQLRELSIHLLTVREEEKAYLAREIHDELGSTLVALKMDAHWLASKLPAKAEMLHLSKCVKSMEELISNAVIATRSLITDLRPPMLDDIGLIAALEWHAAEFEKRTGIECRVVCAHMQDTGCKGCNACEYKLDKLQLIALYRIFQEALANVAKHSGASRVEVKARPGDNEAFLSVSDNGCGLRKNHAAASTSFGMRGMRERVEQLGGEISFDRPTAGGLCVAVRLPLSVAFQ